MCWTARQLTRLVFVAACVDRGPDAAPAPGRVTRRAAPTAAVVRGSATPPRKPGSTFRHVNGMTGRVLLSRDHRARRGAVRLRQRRRPGRVSGSRRHARRRAPLDAPTARRWPAVPQRSVRRPIGRPRTCDSPTSPRPAASTRGLRHGRRGRRLRQRRVRRPVPDRARAATSSCATTVTARSPTSGRRAAPTIRLERVGGVPRLRSRRLAGSLRRPLPELGLATPNTPCFGPSGARDYCAPAHVSAAAEPAVSQQRDGTFTDVSAAAGMAAQFGPALGVSTADFNSDGWIDLYVANDGQENQLWINQQQRHVQELGAAVRRRAQRPAARPRRAWASTPATSTTTATKICS